MRHARLSRKQPEVILVPAQACNRFLQSDEKFFQKKFFVVLQLRQDCGHLLFTLIDEPDSIKGFILTLTSKLNFSYL